MTGEVWVSIQPDFPLLIPSCDLGAESVGGVETEVGLLIKRVVGIGGVVVGSDLGEDPIGFFDEYLVFDIVGGKVTDTNGATEDEDGDEATEDCDLDVVKRFVDLTVPGTAGGPDGAVGGGGGGELSWAASLLSRKKFKTHIIVILFPPVLLVFF